MGGAFVGFCILMGSLALAFGNLFFGLVSCFLGLSLLLSALGTWLNIRDIKAREKASPEIFAEKEILYPVTLFAPGLCFALSAATPYGEGTLVSLHRKKDITLRLRFPKRGRFEVPLELVSAFPLGLFEGRKTLLVLKITVFPKPQQTRWEELSWLHETRSNTNLAGEEFGEHAPFTGREPLTRIDWKASARHDTPVVYRFEDDKEGLLLDLDSSPGDRETLLSKACFLLLEARRRNLKIGLVLKGRLWPPGTHIYKLLEALALA